MQKLTGVINLIIIEDSIDGHIDLHTKGTGILAELSDIVDTVACRRTRSEARGSDIDGVGAMVDGRHAASQVLGRSQQFK